MPKKAKQPNPGKAKGHAKQAAPKKTPPGHVKQAARGHAPPGQAKKKSTSEGDMILDSPKRGAGKKKKDEDLPRILVPKPIDEPCTEHKFSVGRRVVIAIIIAVIAASFMVAFL